MSDSNGAPALKPDPSGLVYGIPELAEGEAPLPFPLTASVGLTPPDSTGKRWGTLVLSDGTVTASFRIPFQNAAQFGAGIAKGLAAIQAKGEEMAHGGLVVPGQSGKLLLPGQVRG